MYIIPCIHTEYEYMCVFMSVSICSTHICIYCIVHPVTALHVYAHVHWSSCTDNPKKNAQYIITFHEQVTPTHIHTHTNTHCTLTCKLPHSLRTQRTPSHAHRGLTLFIWLSLYLSTSKRKPRTSTGDWFCPPLTPATLVCSSFWRR